ncbi:FAD-binding protein [Bacteroides thetaiotaomicron]|uniref:FAD-binding and (Fe-S)-binding domain-containing protein n=1 Tax=Bacteroides thetaiotaomicron TaxID=818 RepID=UPI001C38C60B|nr:FAD-binding and (Fe-S)-binding domain-containing protein [Bacteroides thetaiotaomicron]MBV4311916.1 FAD-binding protein [Bacteroides thetaiotaomicron]MCB7385284.1 FAD-binding protein [Bacteroides thetaiotaomicron]MCG4884723.1 FAD-binding protein [Bacteroides thetaiotaomicron]MCQ5251207.1 FAD-binding protein [Bacteroides thetaiotaomicron]
MQLIELQNKIQGELFTDTLHRIIYSTDASGYREEPLGVVYPKDSEDIRIIVSFAIQNHLNLIPRAGGTSLAGQVVGKGLVVDISKHMNRILEIRPEESWIRIQPGVILDELNLFCKPYGLFFGPETSTSNRCCLGGMVGNNSCGSHSLVYGSTRDHLLEAKVVLSDGSEVTLKGLNRTEIEEKQKDCSLEGKIYKQLIDLLSNQENQKEIIDNYPDISLRRRNSGYAIDELLRCNYFDQTCDEPFNLCKLLAGSEGTLAFVTELKLHLVPLPPVEKAVICVHCSTLEESFEANLVALKHHPVAIELMDNNILELSKQNISQNKNRFFIQGDPAAILIIELAEDSTEAVDRKADEIEADLRKHHYGYHYPRIYGKDISRVWNLRKAGLGLLSGMPGSAKPVSVIEDTAVAPYRLPAYIADLKKVLEHYNLSCVYHAHISTGELHLRPVLNLKEKKDRELFRMIATETAKLVKKHKGSLSGEHGDGRLRGEFIPLLLGDQVYGLLKDVKNIWDPSHIFNMGKIVDTPPMDVGLRYEKKELNVPTYFNYSHQKGWLCAIEQCNGAGDCRKSDLFGGTMCPTYRATRNEKNTTRARANVLRELLTHPKTENVFKQPEILEVLDTCVSCKACKSECPSNIDMARFKAEYLQHHYDVSHVPLRSFLIANLIKIQKMGMVIPWLYNGIVSVRLTSSLLKGMLRFAPERSIPKLYKMTLRNWLLRHSDANVPTKGTVYLFADEFTNYMDVEIGIRFIELLRKLGYSVLIPEHVESGRTEISKGMLKKAKVIAEKNVTLLQGLITEDTPLIGIEPSCILSFRDEYPDLVSEHMKVSAAKLAVNSLLYDEFIVREIKKGNIIRSQFTEASLKIMLHGHCYQKSLASIEPSKEMLSLPVNYVVEVIPSGCCGMAGAFGYEKEHYQLSMQIGEQVLFPAIRQTGDEVCISAPGTSCRQQIADGTGRKALHPIEVLYNALIK